MTRVSLALTRVLLLLTATTLQALSVAPPNHAPDEAHQERFHKPSNGASKTNKGSLPDGWTGPKVQRLWSRFGSFYFPYAFVFFFWTLAAFEVPRSFGHRDPLNTRFVSGILVAGLASTLRLASFRSLGHHFTYQLAILPSHKLVTTGPYAYVRHPSYVALPLIVSGFASSFTSEGTVLREWIGESRVDEVVLILLVIMLYVGWQFMERAEAEDRVLKQEFGKEWEEWARVVKHRFIPGLY